MQNDYEKRILKLLKKHSDGLTIIEIASMLKANRATITKYIYKLYGEGKIKFRKVGPAKLCYINNSGIKKSLIISLFLLFLLPGLGFAQPLQSHPLSEITPIDVNLNMYGYNITNVSYIGIGTTLPSYPLHVIGQGYFTGNLITESKLYFGASGPYIFASGGTIYTSSPLTLGGDLDLANHQILNALLGSNLNANSYNITNANTISANKLEGALDWVNLQNYPAGCPAGSAVQAVGDTLTCVDLSNYGNITGTGTTNYIPIWTSSSTLGNSNIYQNAGLIYTTSGLVLGGNLNLSNNNLTNANVVSANTLYGNLECTDCVTLGTETTGNYVSGITAGTGISVSGTPGEGWSPTVSVIFGSTAGTAAEGNKQITISAGSGLSGGGTITIGAGGTVSLAHADTSSQASVTNTALTFIQNVTLDTFGHVTGLASATINAGNGLTASGTTLNVGAGTGIVVGADTVSIDTNIVPRKNVDETITGLWTFNSGALVNKNLEVNGTLNITNIANFTPAQITFYQPLSIEASGPLSIANGIELTDSTANTINSYGTFYLKTSGPTKDIVLAPTGIVGLQSNLDMGGYNITNADVIQANAIQADISPTGNLNMQGYDIYNANNVNATAFWQSGKRVIDTITAGNGLGGGGSGPTVTLNVNVNTAKGLQIANDALEVKAGTGLSFDANGNLSVVYGSSAGTAAEGNKQITINAGPGLTGGGTITIGAGGSTTLSVNFGTNFLGWSNLTNYPPACPAGQAIAALGDTITCVDVNPSGTITGSISSGQVAFGTGTNTIGGDNNLYWDNTNKRLGIGTSTPAYRLDVNGSIRTNGDIICTDCIALGSETTGNYVAGINAGSGITVTGSGGEGSTPTIAHADTSSQASVTNSGGTVIQSVGLDTYGHVTSLSSVNLDNRYPQKAAAETITGSWTFNAPTTFNQDVTVMKNLRVAGNITYVNVQNINVNGSLIPPLDNWFDIGNSSNRWRNGYFAGTVYANSFEGSISANNVEDIWVNETGDTMTGKLTITSGGLEVTGGNVNLANLNVDSGTLYVDAVNNRVGIGTTSPTYTLDVNKAGDYIFHLGDNAGNDLDISIAGGQGLVTLAAGAKVSGNNYVYTGTRGASAQSWHDGEIRFWTMGTSGTAGADTGWDWNNPDMIIKQGNVGIGTASPGAKLDVAGETRATVFKDRDNTSYYVDPSGTSNLAGNLYVGGNVGIGTTSPAYKLDVNGDIRANTVNLNSLLNVNRWFYAGRYDNLLGLARIMPNAFGFNPPYKVEEWNSTTSTWDDITTSYNWAYLTDLKGTEIGIPLTANVDKTIRFYFDVNGWDAGDITAIVLYARWINALKQVKVESSPYSDFSSSVTTNLDWSGSIGHWDEVTVWHLNSRTYGNRYIRVTFTFMRTSNGQIRLRELMGLSYASTSRIFEGYLPFDWDYNKNVFFSGNVGIGTTNPQYKLDVNGDIRATGTIYGTFSGNTQGDLTVNGNLYVKNAIYDSDDTDVNIGEDLTVSGNLKAPIFYDLDNTAYYLDPAATSNLNTIQLNDANTKILEGSGNAVRIQTNSGYVDVGPQNTGYTHFSTDRPAFWFNKQVQVNGGVIAAYNSPMYLQAPQGTTRVYIDNSNGNVGIGTTSPSEKLEVNGNIKLSSANPYINMNGVAIKKIGNNIVISDVM